ncbi:LysR family transcriptional regulator, partial [Acinetobacter baumannii]
TLRVSSPSISTAIAHIEKLLQTQLFVRRHARGLVLTSAGRDFAAHARNILLQAREMELMGDRGRYQVRSRVNLGCLATLAPYLVPRLLTEV